MPARNSLILTSISDLHQKKYYIKEIYFKTLRLSVFSSSLLNCKPWQRINRFIHVTFGRNGLDMSSIACESCEPMPSWFSSAKSFGIHSILVTSCLGNRESSYIRPIRARSPKKLHYSQRQIIARFELRGPPAKPSYLSLMANSSEAFRHRTTNAVDLRVKCKR